MAGLAGDSGPGFHAAINVGAMEPALGFYRDLLGFPVAWEHVVEGPLLESLTGIPNVRAEVVQLVCAGGSRLELTCYEPVGRRRPPAPNDVGPTHVSLEVDDVGATQDRLEAHAIEFASRPILIEDAAHPLDGWTVTYLQDPDGTTLELLQRPAVDVY